MVGKVLRYGISSSTPSNVSKKPYLEKQAIEGLSAFETIR